MLKSPAQVRQSARTAYLHVLRNLFTSEGVAFPMASTGSCETSRLLSIQRCDSPERTSAYSFEAWPSATHYRNVKNKRPKNARIYTFKVAREQLREQVGCCKYFELDGATCQRKLDCSAAVRGCSSRKSQ